MNHAHQQLLPRAHDRAALRRTDQAWLAERWRDPTTRVLVVAENRIAPWATGSVPAWRAPGDVPEGTRLLLGERDGVTYFAVLVDAGYAADDWVDLRGSLPALRADATDAALVLQALGMAEWHRAARFCTRCGEPLGARSEGYELACAAGHVTFPRTDPAVIMIITDGERGAEDERCLLGNHINWPEGRYSTLAGFCEPGESLEDAVRREVAEETGVRVGPVSYFGNQPWPLPASLMLGFTGRAESTEVHCNPEEMRTAGWFTRAELRAGAESGELRLPSAVSISRALIEDWYGGSLPGGW